MNDVVDSNVCKRHTHTNINKLHMLAPLKKCQIDAIRGCQATLVSPSLLHTVNLCVDMYYIGLSSWTPSVGGILCVDPFGRFPLFAKIKVAPAVFFCECHPRITHYIDYVAGGLVLINSFALMFLGTTKIWRGHRSEGSIDALGSLGHLGIYRMLSQGSWYLRCFRFKIAPRSNGGLVTEPPPKKNNNT